MSSAALTLSIIIVNWRSVALLRHCLHSIFANAPPFSFEVIVIDNASFDGSQAMIESEFPMVLFIQSATNLGFAKANNRAFQSATGRILLFLNPDTEVLGDALERMTRFLESTPCAGAIGCKLLNSDGTLQLSCVQAFPTILNQIIDAEVFRRLMPRSQLWGMQVLHSDLHTPAPVEGISGACLMLRRTAFLDVNCFTDEYFMYAEDLDLCYKLACAGLTNYYISDSTVVHHGGKSTAAVDESQFTVIVLRESIARYFRLHRGPTYAYLYRTLLALSALVRLFALALPVAFSLGLWRPTLLKVTSRKWVRILRWAVGWERWAEQLGAGAV